MFCTRCGKQIEDDSKFCGFCGAPVEDSEVETVENQDDVEKAEVAQSVIEPEEKQEVTEQVSDSDSGGFFNPTGQNKEKDNKLTIIIGILVVIGIAFSYFGYGKYLDYQFEDSLTKYEDISVKIQNISSDIKNLSGDTDEDKHKKCLEDLKAALSSMQEISEYYDKGRLPSEQEINKYALQQRAAAHVDLLEKMVGIMEFNEPIAGELNVLYHTQYKDKLNDFTSACSTVKTTNYEPLKGIEKDPVTFINTEELSSAITVYTKIKYNYDSKQVQENQKKYAVKLAQSNEALKQKKELVFLIGNVVRSGNDGLTLTGTFYNGTSETISGIKDMLVDVTLKNGDSEVFTVKDVQYQNPIMERVSIAPGAMSAPQNIIIKADIPNERYDNFEVSCHKIHWKVRKLVKR